MISRNAEGFLSANNSIVLRFLSLGNNSITESYISLLKDQYQASSQSANHLLTQEWFTNFSIQLIVTRSVKLNQLLSSFGLPLLRMMMENKVLSTK